MVIIARKDKSDEATAAQIESVRFNFVSTNSDDFLGLPNPYVLVGNAPGSRY